MTHALVMDGCTQIRKALYAARYIQPWTTAGGKVYHFNSHARRCSKNHRIALLAFVAAADLETRTLAPQRAARGPERHPTSRHVWRGDEMRDWRVVHQLPACYNQAPMLSSSDVSKYSYCGCPVCLDS